MKLDPTKLYEDCLRLLLRPVIRFCLRKSLTIQALLESAKAIFIEVAAEEMIGRGEKVNISRLSVMTGMHRRDVMRIYRDGRIADTSPSFVGRVVGQWEQDPRFLTKVRKPRVLTLEGEDSEFRDLVRLVSKDINPGTVLFELERIGAVERVGRGLKLKKPAITISQNPLQSFQLLSKDTDDLISAVEENVFEDPELKNLHASTEYDNVCQEDLPKIRQWLLKEGLAFHLKARNFFARFDKDVNPQPNKEGGARVIVGTFSRTTGGNHEEEE